MANLPPPGTSILSGAESQRLRTFCANETYTAADLDSYATLLQRGPLAAIKADFEKRVEAVGVESARKQLSDVAYGPTKIPLFNYILQLTILVPYNRPLYLSYFRYFANEALIPVDATDLSGTTTLMYSISTKPYFDPEVADILLDAGGNINHRNRYGCVAAHDIVMATDYSPSGKKKTVDALKYFIEKGGNINTSDGDGLTAKFIGTRVLPLVPELGPLLGAGGTTPAAAGKKTGRNDPCHCGSKKKFKVCHGKV